MPTEDTAPNWREVLPEDLRDNPALKDFHDVGALAKSYTETKAMVGGMMRVPGEDAGKEDWAAFNAKLMDKVPGLVKMPAEDDEDGLNALWTKLGRPVTDEGYTAPEGVEITDADKATAKQLGLTAKQFQEYVKLESTRDAEETDAARDAQSASKNEVLGEWGAAKEQKLRQIRIMLENTGAPEGVKTAASELNVDGAFLRWAETIVTSMGSEAQNFATDGGQSPTGAALTPDEARSQLAEIMQNPGHAFHNKQDPSNRAAIQKVLDLHDYAAGREPSTKI